LSNDDSIARQETARAEHRLAIDEDSVGALQILDCDGATIRDDPSVSPRNKWIIENDIAFRAPSDQVFSLPDLDVMVAETKPDPARVRRGLP
jgi:hypothetical protein